MKLQCNKIELLEMPLYMINVICAQADCISYELGGEDARAVLRRYLEYQLHYYFSSPHTPELLKKEVELHLREIKQLIAKPDFTLSVWVGQ